MTVDDSKMQPITLMSNGTLEATEKLSGSSTGPVTTSKGRLDYKPSPGGTDNSVLLGPEGTPVGTPTADTGVDTSYTCTPHASLALDEGGGLFLGYAPQ